MKRRFKKFVALALTGAMLSSMAATALASEALGESLAEKEQVLHEDTTLATNVFWSQAYTDLRTENLITYSPNRDVLPMVTFGDVLTERSTLSAMSRKLEAQGYRVVAGINGDYYNTSTGLPVGIVVTEGLLRSGDGGYCALGFRKDGTAVVGKPQVQMNADLGYAVYDEWGNATQILRRITSINKARVSEGGIYLYTYDFNDRHNTGNTEAGVDVLCTVQEGEIAIGETVTLQVEQVIEATSATVMAENQVVLSANLKSGDYFANALRNVPVGAAVTIQFTAADEVWNDVEYAVGALYQLAEDGAVLSGLPAGASPRTAVGIKPDGDLVFYTIDGRKAGHSVGASLTQVAERLLELGCEDVVAMDGGGSTTLAITEPSAVEAAYINRPSDGRERSVSNQIFLVAGNEASDRLHHFYVKADRDFVLAGSKVNITASGVDTNYIPMEADYKLSVSDGELEDHVLTTPATGGEVTVTAKSGSKKGSTTVYAVAEPEEVTVRNSSGTAISKLTAIPGSVVDLSAAAVYRHRQLWADPELFAWTVDGNIGTIDETGRFSVGSPGNGTITVTAGGKSAVVEVEVSWVPLETVEDFEGNKTVLDGTGNGVEYSLTDTGEFVTRGRRAAKFDYMLGEGNGFTAEWRPFRAVGINTAVYPSLNLWLYGDGSGNTLQMLYSNDTEEFLTKDLAVLDFTGWKQLTVPLSNYFELQGFKITSGNVTYVDDGLGGQIPVYPETSYHGTIYMDQLVATFDGVVDHEVPIVKLEVDEENGKLSALISDAVDKVLAEEQISVKASMGGVKGADVPFAYEKPTGRLTVDLPQDLSATGSVRITVAARDASGNIGRASLDLVDENMEYAFTDIADYWGANFVNFLYTSGVTTGYADGTFLPNRNITRAQFSVMLYRYLGIPEERYADKELPFADLAAIPEYAIPAIRALYAMGVINGTTGKDGRLYFNPQNNLTRAQAATMIGRTQEKGYAVAELTFTDAAKIPAYATGYIQTMVAQEILGGYADGTFRPNNNITRGQMAKILYNLM